MPHCVLYRCNATHQDRKIEVKEGEKITKKQSYAESRDGESKIIVIWVKSDAQPVGNATIRGNSDSTSNML